MSDMWRDVSSLWWWVSVVVVGVGVNLVAASLKPWFDRVMSRVSTSWHNRTEALREARLQRIALLRSDQNQQILVSIWEVGLKVRSLKLFVQGMVMAAISVAAAVAIGEPGIRLHPRLAWIALIVASVFVVGALLESLRDWVWAARIGSEVAASQEGTDSRHGT